MTPRVLVAMVLCTLAATATRADVYWVTVAGLGGEPDYAQRFASEAAETARVLAAAGPTMHVRTLAGAQATRMQLAEALEQVQHEATPDDLLVLLLIGHGSYDGVTYKFNLPGPDISAAQLAQLCDAVPARRQLIVNTTSASGGSIPALQRSGRAVIAATKSGTEKNATVFSRYWIEALQDPAADLDKSDSISALEAFEYATRKTAEFYQSQKRLATEHAVFEDVGRGTPVREPAGAVMTSVPAAAAAGDAAATTDSEGRLLASLTLVRLGAGDANTTGPARRELLARKERLLQQIDALKYQKAAMADNAYQTQLKALLLDLARTQAALDQ